MTRHETPLHGVFVLESPVRGDERGTFQRAFCAPTLTSWGLDPLVVQANVSFTRDVGVIRGIHFQRPPFAETKIVRCLAGGVLDVVVDLRAGSPTFLQYHAVELRGEDGLAMYIPKGCGHGFQTLCGNTQLLYLHSAVYSPESEGGVHALDPGLRINWPVPVSQMSDRDRGFALITAQFEGISP